MATSTPKATPRRTIGATIGLVIGLLLGGGLTYIGGAAVVSELRLRSGAAEVEAEVLDTRITRSRSAGTSYELQYQFRLPDSPQVYTRRDETGRAALWASVPEHEWHAASASDRLAVTYLPGDPWVNRPVNAGAAPLGDPLAGLVLGLLIALPCLLLLLGVRRRA